MSAKPAVCPNPKCLHPIFFHAYRVCWVMGCKCKQTKKLGAEHGA
jgi:hypothetical protein